MIEGLCIQHVYVHDGIIGLEGGRDLGSGYYNLKQSRSIGIGDTRRVLPLALDKGHSIIGGRNVGRIRNNIITEYITAKIRRRISFIFAINVDFGPLSGIPILVFTFKRQHKGTSKDNRINRRFIDLGTSTRDKLHIDIRQ